MRLATADCGTGNEAWLLGEGSRHVVQEFEGAKGSPAVRLSLRGICHSVAKNLGSHVVCSVGAVVVTISEHIAVPIATPG